jgi:hypothetical protein
LEGTLGLAHKLRSSKVDAERLSQTKVMQRGIKFWLETKKTSSSNWVKFIDGCCDSLALVFLKDNGGYDSDAW